MWQRYARPILGVLLIGGMIAALGCADKPTVPQQATQPLAVNIVAGPDTSSSVDHGSKVTFKWQPVGGSGTYTFRYKVDTGAFDTVTAGQTSIIFSDTTLLTPGAHTFTVEINDTKGTATATRNFAIKARGTRDTVLPTVTIAFPPAGYKLPPGGSVRFEWTVSDASNGTSVFAKAGVAKVGWAVDDTLEVDGVTPKPSWALSANIPLTGAGSNLATGWHYIYVQAQDNSGNITVKKDSVEAIPPTILYVNEAVLEPGYDLETPRLSEANEFRRSRYFFGAVFDGFSVQEWNVAAQGYPTTADVASSIKTIVWVGSGDHQSSSWGWNVGYEYTYSFLTGAGLAPNVLTTFVDNGGTVWITGENWIEEINVGISDVRDSTLEFMYLGMDTTWDAHGPAEVVFDFAAMKSGWPALSTDIAKVQGGIGDQTDWTTDYFPVGGTTGDSLKANVEALYKVSGYAVEGTSTPPPAAEDWVAAWLVKGPGGDPQLVFMGFDAYYFSADAGSALGKKILKDLFGN